MSTKNVEKVLRMELKNLNEQIDLKILKGLSYAREAKRHKYIVHNLARIKREQFRSNWLVRTFSVI